MKNEKTILERTGSKMNKGDKQYHLFSDPGHGWLRVKKSEIDSLGIAEKISKYSHTSKRWKTKYVFLEEDDDMEVFIAAKKKQNPGWELDAVEHTLPERESIIRSFETYDPKF